MTRTIEEKKKALVLKTFEAFARRNSLPLAYRLGAKIWRNLGPAATSLSAQPLFRTFLSGPAQTRREVQGYVF